MNTQDFSQPKFPLSTQTMQFMQEQNLLVADAIGAIIGRNAILKKATLSSPGLCIINGEILPLYPCSSNWDSSLQYCVIDEEKQTVTASGQTFPDVRTKRTANLTTSPSGHQSYIRRSALADMTFYGALLPKGSIIMWSGSTDNIPEGFKLCKGGSFNHVTIPDLRGRFIVGYSDTDTDTDYNHIGNTGGEKTHVLNENEMPQHNHVYRDAYFAEHTSIDDDYSKADTSKPANFFGTNEGTDNDNYPIYLKDNPSTANCGGGAAHENRPPYYVLAFIIKVI